MITSPTPYSTRSSLADWLELTALLRGRAAGSGDLDSLLRLNSDGDRELIVTSDEPLEEEIAETKRDALIARVSEEISFREITLQDDYPFVVEGDPLRLKLRDNQNGSSHPAYLFMLIMTGFKDKLLTNSDALVSSIGRGRTLFHHCASFGVAGLLEDGHTYWFGWPRPDKAPFASALEDMCARLGFGRAKSPPPPGLPTKAKDDQIDVVGWRAFRDRRNATLLVICQAATGNDWTGKSVLSHLGAFTEWFERSPYKLAMASLAVPFTVHHEVDDLDGEDYDEAVFNALQRLNYQHGVVLDRLRITECIRPIVASGTAEQRVGGYVGMSVLTQWIDSVKPLLVDA